MFCASLAKSDQSNKKSSKSNQSKNPVKPYITPIWPMKGWKWAVFLPCVSIGGKLVVKFNEGMEHLSAMISFTSSIIDTNFIDRQRCVKVTT